MIVQLKIGTDFERLRVRSKFTDMKTFTKLLFVLLLLGLFSCVDETLVVEGPPGPQGIPGATGAQGESGYVFEFSDIDFVAPEYEVFLPFPDDFEVLTSDVVLVYFLWDVQEVDGIATEVWRPLPQTVFTLDGTLQYNFDFTVLDTRLFLDANFPLDWLEARDTDQWVARVVVAPGNFWGSGRLATAPSYEEVKSRLGLPELDTERTIKIDRR